MKFFFFILFISIIKISTAATYYFSNVGGSDGYTSIQAQNKSTPWKSLNKLNLIFNSLNSGDSILFKRGESFYGSITISKSGIITNPIFLGAYGTGEKPIITGFTDVTKWTNLGSNIWESTNSISTLATLNMVVINGVNTPMGRIPNTGFYTYQSHNANISVTSSSLTGPINWTGAELVIKKEAWLFHRATITSQSGSTISYIDEFSDSYSPRDGWGFFIQNDKRTLDTQNEWYYNPSTHKIDIYSTTQPTGVQVATQNIIFQNNNKSYITFDNLEISGADSIALYVIGGNNNIVQNCYIHHAGYDGINLEWSNGCALTNNIIRCCGDRSISNGVHDTNTTITWNTIDSTSMINGINRQYAGAAIYFTGTPSLVQYNTIDHSGYDGIIPSDKSTIKNNFINKSVLKRTDGGGIYCGGAYTSMLFDSNIILNSFGDTSGTTGLSQVGAEGIYLDINTANVTIANNTCAGNGQYGIMVSRSNNNTITGNTCYNNSISQIEFENWDGTNDAYSNVMNNNIFVAKITTQLALAAFSSINSIQKFGIASNNIYYSPINDSLTFRTSQPSEYSNGGEYKTLTQWKIWTGQDGNSNKVNRTITDTGELRFEYNASDTKKVIPIQGAYISVNGDFYLNNVTLAPYSSLILIKDITGQILPLQFLNFEGDRIGNKIELNWKTLNELNTAFFEAEKSTDGLNFKTIGQLISKNKSFGAAYTLVDNNPVAGKNYYRIKQIDKDGKYNYSKTIVISFVEPENLQIIPNPALDKILVSVNSSQRSQNARLFLRTITGDIIKNIPIGSLQQHIPVDISNLASGVYHISVIYGNTVISKQFIKQ